MASVITLLTDFGTADGYVGEMKGVLLTALPGATIVDVTHDIAPQDTEGARLAVARYWRRFPPATVHVVVIDPGVGTSRAAIAVASENRFLVGPDNGILSPALLMPGASVVALAVPADASPTFHGRDVFAPAAARIASGATLGSLGASLSDPVVRRTPEPHRAADGSVVGEIIHLDRFGNAITNLLAPQGGAIELLGRVLPLQRTYADVGRGELVAITGSSGLVEIAVRDGNAERTLGLERGREVRLRARSG